ncbi:hypothetical protein C8R43DRAFT_598563 [Mycena crocata]|nr:hypothetical protein C8R43DRAFT_598563 [Mycena crocata]
MISTTLDAPPSAALALPYELTSKIFLHCLPLDRRIRPGRKRAPLQLSQICSHWRAVALATPELWSSIYLEFSRRVDYEGVPWIFDMPGGEVAVDHTCELVELWLARSVSFPTSITLLCRGNEIRLPHGLLSTISDHSAHCDRIELAVTKADLLDFNEIVGPFPLLRSLVICVSYSWGMSPPLRIHRCSQNLVALTFCDAFHRTLWPVDYADIPSSVTALKISQPYLGGGWDGLFRRLPHLCHLSVAGWGDFNSLLSLSEGQIRSPIASSLRSLQLTDLRVLKFIDLPALEHLDVVVGPSSVNHLATFLSQSAPGPCHLTLRFWAAGEHLIACLLAATSVNHLHLFFQEHGAVTFRNRYLFLHQADAVPALRTLVIMDPIGVAGTYTPFLEMIYARPDLERAVLHMRPRHVSQQQNMAPPDQEIESKFEALSAAGLDLSVTAPRYMWPPSASFFEDTIAQATLDGIFEWDKTSAYKSSSVG